MYFGIWIVPQRYYKEHQGRMSKNMVTPCQCISYYFVIHIFCAYGLIFSTSALFFPNPNNAIHSIVRLIHILNAEAQPSCIECNVQVHLKRAAHSLITIISLN